VKRINIFGVMYRFEGGQLIVETLFSNRGKDFRFRNDYQPEGEKALPARGILGNSAR
jgi:hypothetical protein